MGCVVAMDGDQWTIDPQNDAYPLHPRDGLGDRVAAFLSTFGITKARAQAVAQAVGLEDCGCAERQRRLNELGWLVGIGVEPPKKTAGSAVDR